MMELAAMFVAGVAIGMIAVVWFLAFRRSQRRSVSQLVRPVENLKPARTWHRLRPSAPIDFDRVWSPFEED